MKLAARVLSVVSAMLLSLSANATTYTLDFTYDGTTVTSNLTAAGSLLEIGDTVNTTIHAAGGHWEVGAGENLWTPISVFESGDRTGDLSWSLLSGGVTVDSGNDVGQLSQFVHITNPFETNVASSFDTLTWSYVLTGSTASANTFTSYVYTTVLALPPATFVASSVPEPETYAMLLAGLMTVGAIARRRRRS